MILRLFQRFSRKQKPTELGRWSLLNSSDALQKRIDMANIDHCGDRWIVAVVTVVMT